MPVSFQLTVGQGKPSDALTEALQSVEVEENADRPDAMTITLPVNRTPSGDLSYVDDGTFEPYRTVSVILKAGRSSECVFDGYVLSWRLHVDRVSANSSIQVWAQDASWLMNISDVVREWPGLTDWEVANSIFTAHGFAAAAANEDAESPAYLPGQHSLFQRGTDLQFLYGLARRNGKICRVTCADRPGTRTGYFTRPLREQSPVAAIRLTDPDSWNVDALDVDWDVMRPTEVRASQASLTTPAGGSATATSSGLPALGSRSLRAYADPSSALALTTPVLPGANKSTAMLLTATADPQELAQRTRAVLAESGWFARCEGEADLDRLGTVLRAGTVVTVDGAGRAHSGNWLVWRVNHHIKPGSCRTRFTLVRNAIGPLGPPGGGL